MYAYSLVNYEGMAGKVWRERYGGKGMAGKVCQERNVRKDMAGNVWRLP